MLFPRGQYGTNLFPQVENLRGDRDGGLDALSGGHGTRSYDTCGYMPRVVRQSAALLFQAVGRYGIVSSISTEHRRDLRPVLALPGHRRQGRAAYDGNHAGAGAGAVRKIIRKLYDSLSP